MVGRIYGGPERDNFGIGIGGNGKLGPRGNAQGTAVIKGSNILRAKESGVLACALQHQKGRKQTCQSRKLNSRRRRGPIIQWQRGKRSLHRISKVKAWVGHRQSQPEVQVGRRLNEHRKVAICRRTLVG